MPCYKPNLAFRHKSIKQPLRFIGRKHYRLEDGTDAYESDAYKYYSRHSEWQPLALPCGQCTFCRLQNSKDKAIRMYHQSKLSDYNCFLTLTYNDQNLPKNNSIDPKATQKFMKDLRAKYPLTKMKSFGCAEYGENRDRPHYHLCLFNFDFPDKKFWRYSENDWSDERWPVYRSEILEKLWPYGYSEIGTLTYESAAYVARYVTKKLTGEKKQEYGDRLPERCVSVSKGIGLEYVKTYSEQLYANDFLIVNGIKHKLPRYYDKKLEQIDSEKFLLVKNQRFDNIKKIDMDGTKNRLKTRERIHELKAKQLKRGLK